MFGVVLVDELRQPEGAGHAGRPTADDHNVSFHYGTIDIRERLTKDDHLTIPEPKTCILC